MASAVDGTKLVAGVATDVDSSSLHFGSNPVSRIATHEHLATGHFGTQVHPRVPLDADNTAAKVSGNSLDAVAVTFPHQCVVFASGAFCIEEGPERFTDVTVEHLGRQNLRWRLLSYSLEPYGVDLDRNRGLILECQCEGHEAVRVVAWRLSAVVRADLECTGSSKTTTRIRCSRVRESDQPRPVERSYTRGQEKMQGLAGRVALVTGAGRGIGRAICLAYGIAGAKVAVSARSTGELDSIVEEIRESGGTAEAFPADLSDPATPASLLASVAESLGTVEVLVNNAGVGSSSDPKPLVEFDDEFWNLTLEVNLNAPYRLTKTCLAPDDRGGLGPGDHRGIYQQSDRQPSRGRLCRQQARSAGTHANGGHGNCNPGRDGQLYLSGAGSDVDE